MGSLSSPSLAEPRPVALFVLGDFEEAFDVVGLALGAPELGDRGDFLFGDEGRMDTLQARGSRREIEHVAAAPAGFRRRSNR